MEDPNSLDWKKTFFQDNFNVDQCLSKYTQKSDLGTLRSDLRQYGNELHQQMADILKTETEAIVNLAEYLTSLNLKIDDLSLPISQLKEEIKTLYELVKDAHGSYCTALLQIKSNNTKRNHLILKSGIITSAMYIDEMIKLKRGVFEDCLVLERAVNKFSFDYNYLEEFGLPSDMIEITNVGKRLTEMVNRAFLKSVDQPSDLLRCLRMYDNLGEQCEAERTYQIHVVRPVVKKIFNEKYLEKCNQDINLIYNEVLHFVDSKMAVLLTVLAQNPDLKSYNFVLNSFWVEVDKQSREGLLDITAPGNPELFQKRFKSTWNFLLAIARKCDNEDVVYTSSFQSHIKRFNLAVYFEIRFQQIAGTFEADAIIKPGREVYLQDNEIGCKLKVTLGLWNAFLRCFSDDVFIDNMTDQFVKLTMLLLSRYLKWFQVALASGDSFTEGSEAWEDFMITSLFDLNLVKRLIGNPVSDGLHPIYGVIPDSLKGILPKLHELNRNTIDKVYGEMQQHLVTIKCSESLAHLHSVTSIPRIYRRTNRGPPKEASNYVIETVQPILKLYNKYKVMDELEFIINTVITKVTQQYLSLVKEVLTSVCKTEESLRRLKNRNTNSADTVSENAEGSENTMSDEMKIREQIKLDVRYFIDKLGGLSLESARSCMDELKQQTS